MSGWRALVATLAVGLAASLVAASAAPAAGASYPDGLVWLALGDSYSSGEGLRYVDQDANPADTTCERATGRTSVNNGQGSRAWAAVAYGQVREAMTNSTFRLLACTGATSNEIHAQYRDEWLAGGEPRADLITFSMGGNNLGFADVIQRCIGLSIDNSTGAGIVLNPAIGCDTTESELKAAIDQLVGTSGVGPDGGQTLRDMYREVAENAVNQGGHVVVAGYPNLVEESGRWTIGWLEGNRCSRIRRADTAMLRSAIGYLNEQTAKLVAEVNGQYNNVSFHWLDVSQVYENDSGRHGLCTEDPWINGITFGIAGPDSGLNPIRYQRSFHPNQKGHDATGTATANLIQQLDWTNLRRTTDDTAVTAPPPPAANQIPEGVDPAFVQVLLEVLGADNVVSITPKPGDYATINYEPLDGPITSDAIATIQTTNGLPATGALDAATWDAIVVAAAELTKLGTCDGLLTRPTDFQLACNSLTTNEGITWSQWTPFGGTGTGTARIPCPNYECSDGNSYETIPVTLEVRAPIRFNCGDGDPWLVFTEMTFTIQDWEPNTFQLYQPSC